MARKSKKKTNSKIKLNKQELLTELGMPRATWSLRPAKAGDQRTGRRGYFIVLGAEIDKSDDVKLIRKLLKNHLNRQQLDSFFANQAEMQNFAGANGPVWIQCRDGSTNSPVDLGKSMMAALRDLSGSAVAAIAASKIDRLLLEFVQLQPDEVAGVALGFAIGSYVYSEHRGNTAKPKRTLPELVLLGKESAGALSIWQSAQEVGLAVNVARHFVNLPPNDLNPTSFARLIEEMFAGSTTTKVEVWEGERLQQQRMRLLLAVGGGASHQAKFVYVKYRPKAKTIRSKVAVEKPIAIVGKGITFDSGGLDLKPSSNMRLMKKDMGGAAAAIAIAKWAEMSELDQPLDVYVSLAENAVDASSFRPSDVIVARNGLSVEIDNTDAEGRLVLADALDVAINQAEKPAVLIDIATLTGAIKVGLGVEIAGLFSNHEQLAEELFTSGLRTGDLMWRMPLFQPYKASLKSNYADLVNSSPGGFGGAITAALFLQNFVGKVPWAHLDIYAWKDGAQGAWGEGGGSGQAVMAICEFLTSQQVAR